MSNSEPNLGDLNFWRSYRVGLHDMPRAWVWQGENLRLSFEVLAESNDQIKSKGPLANLHEPMMMLAGMAIEVKLKALVISDVTKKTAILSNDRLVTSIFYSHDLVVLSELAGVNLGADERDTATALSQFVTWRGRYVVPKENRTMEFASIKHRDGTVKRVPGFATIERVRLLMDHVIRDVKSRIYLDCANGTAAAEVV